jgi:hypothetical protein
MENLTYDLLFNNDENSNHAGFAFASLDEAVSYIKRYNGKDESYFADYKGGIVQVICNETDDYYFEFDVI